jgi:hypothetical protein
MADGALPQTRRKRASQITRKIEFGICREIAETGISEAGFRLLTTAEQRQRINSHLTGQRLLQGEQIKARHIRRYWQRRGKALTGTS